MSDEGQLRLRVEAPGWVAELVPAWGGLTREQARSEFTRWAMPGGGSVSRFTLRARARELGWRVEEVVR